MKGSKMILPRMILVRCQSAECRMTFPPFKRPCVPPPYTIIDCPHCGFRNLIIFDEQLKREFARKELGLGKDSEIGELKSELASLRKDVEKIKVRLGKLASEMRKEIVEDIIEEVTKLAKKTPSLFKPV